jgi:N-acetylmuramic acid 6-phosphate (MurNAc-6-P) etherase
MNPILEIMLWPGVLAAGILIGRTWNRVKINYLEEENEELMQKNVRLLRNVTKLDREKKDALFQVELFKNKAMEFQRGHLKNCRK